MGKRKPWWYRKAGIPKARRKVARATGIPTTRAGRQRKVGRMAGCSVLLWAAVAGAAFWFLA